MPRLRQTWIGIATLASIVLLLGAGCVMVRALRGPPDHLPPLPIEPRATGPGVATLHWDRIDPLAYGREAKFDPVAGFRIYAGPSPGKLRLEATLADPRATGYVVRNLPRGTWYYTVTTYTRLGIESPQPPPVPKTIR